MEIILAVAVLAFIAIAELFFESFLVLIGLPFYYLGKFIMLRVGYGKYVFKKYKFFPSDDDEKEELKENEITSRTPTLVGLAFVLILFIAGLIIYYRIN